MAAQVVYIPEEGEPVVLYGDPDCNESPCELHKVCHCKCRCGMGEDCLDCEGTSED